MEFRAEKTGDLASCLRCFLLAAREGVSGIIMGENDRAGQKGPIPPPLVTDMASFSFLFLSFLHFVPFKEVKGTVGSQLGVLWVIQSGTSRRIAGGTQGASGQHCSKPCSQ